MKTLLLLLACPLFVFAAEPNFNRQTIDAHIQIGYGLVIGHVDDDQKQDIILADKTEVVWYKNPGSAEKPWKKYVMARNLTARDNVCVAARDITGDGMVEVAVGANWNPNETNKADESGGIFYLKRPSNPTKPWTPVALPDHEPTTHRMYWVQYEDKFALAVLPLHGVGNKGGDGKTVLVGLYDVADETPKLVKRVETSLHMTHNFESLADPDSDEADVMLVAGKEGYVATFLSGDMLPVVGSSQSKGAGEVRRYPISDRAFVGIEPMHGTDVVMYREVSEGNWKRELIDGGLSQGHALAAGDLLGSNKPDIAAGWRGKDANGKVGVKIYEATEDGWQTHMLDDKIACEDLKLADLDGNGRLDIIAAGRATQNVVIYWNVAK